MLVAYALDSADSEAEEPSDKPLSLTKREGQVLGLIREGRSSKEVARLLFVCKRTIDFHLQNIYEKLGAENRIQAIRRAEVLGLLPDEAAGARQ